MSASTVSITANPTARRRPVVAGEKKPNGIELLPSEVHVNGGAADGENNGAPAVNGKNLSHHSIRGEAGLERGSKDLVQVKRASARRSRNAVAPKAEKPAWMTVVSVFTKNFVLLVVLIGLVQMVRKLALKSEDYKEATDMGLTQFEGQIGEIDSSLKTTTRMIQLQLEVMDKKIENDIESLKREMGDIIDKKGELLGTKLKNLVVRTEGLEKSIGELKVVDWMSKEEFKNFYEELKKEKGSAIGENDVSLDDIRAFAREVVEKEIEKHAADGLGRVDYALETGGAMVVKHSEAFTGGKVRGWFIMRPVVRPAIHPEVHPDAHRILRPSFGEPGQCFPLKGSDGFVQIRLRTAIVPEAVTLEHVAKSVAYDRSTAPKDCRVSGWLQGRDFNSVVDPEKMFLLTEFTYDLEKSNAQTFDVLESASSQVIDTVRLDFASNHGSPLLTCIYRLRVHGYEPDSVSMMAMQQP